MLFNSTQGKNSLDYPQTKYINTKKSTKKLILVLLSQTEGQEGLNLPSTGPKLHV